MSPNTRENRSRKPLLRCCKVEILTPERSKELLRESIEAKRRRRLADEEYQRDLAAGRLK